MNGNFDNNSSSLVYSVRSTLHGLSEMHCNPKHDELVGVTFKAGWDDKEEVSVMVEGNITVDSTMEEIIVDGDVISDIGGISMDMYKYLIQKRSGGKLTLKWDKFKKLTVKSLMNIKNIDEDYIIIIKNRVL